MSSSRAERAATSAGRKNRKQRLGAVARSRYDGSAAQDMVARLKAVDFFNSITLFGAMFLLSALPLMVLVSSFANRRIEHDLTHHLGLNAQAAAVVEGLFRHSHTRSAAAVLFALLLGFAGTVGVAAMVQGDYEQIFDVRHQRHGNLARLVIWVAGLVAWLFGDGLISAVTRSLPAGLLLDVLLGLAVTTAFFWWSMHFLLAGAVAWRPLRLPAVVTAVFWTGLEGFAALYFSSTITSDSRLYGTIGVVFSLVTWFIAMAAVVVLGAVTGDVWQQRRSRA